MQPSLAALLSCWVPQVLFLKYKTKRLIILSTLFRPQYQHYSLVGRPTHFVFRLFFLFFLRCASTLFFRAARVFAVVCIARSIGF